MRHTVFACAALTLAAASSAVPANPHLRALTASAAAAYDDPTVTTTLSMAEADALLAGLDASWEADSAVSADAGAEMAVEAEAAPVRPESVLPGEPYRQPDSDEDKAGPSELVSTDESDDEAGEQAFVIGPPLDEAGDSALAAAPEIDPEIQLAEAAAMAEALDMAYVSEGVIAPERASGDSDDFVWRIAPERLLPGLIDEAETLAQLGDARQPRISVYSDLPYLQPVIERLNQASEMRRSVGLAVAILERGEPVLIYTSGETAAGSGDPITPRTVFRAASLTKSITGVLLAHLEHEGRIRLDDPAPETIRVRNSRRPTVLDLVAHRTGLPRNAYDNRLEAGRPIPAILDETAELNPVCAVGECYTYQNIVFSGASEVVRRSTGSSYENNVRRRLYQRYGMRTAGFSERDLTRAASWARPHRGWQRTVNTPGSPASNYDAVAPAAAAVVSLEDLIAWAQAHLSETGGIPHDIRERIFNPYVATPRETNALNRRFPGRVQETHYGLGWRIYRWGERTLIAHSGYLSGYGAQIVMEPATGFAYIALWNADASGPWRLWPTVMDLRTGDGPGDWLDEIDED